MPIDSDASTVAVPSSSTVTARLLSVAVAAAFSPGSAASASENGMRAVSRRMPPSCVSYRTESRSSPSTRIPSVPRISPVTCGTAEARSTVTDCGASIASLMCVLFAPSSARF